VAATSTSNAWAVGFYFTSTGRQKTIVDHWNGTAWRRVTSPNRSGDNNLVGVGVAVTSSTNAWAVGASLSVRRTLIEHWNGTAWTIVPSPSRGGPALSGVAATSRHNAWAVGSYFNGTADQTLIEHWNGTDWQRVRSPNPGGAANGNSLAGVSATSRGNAWAVGFYSNSTVEQTLALHCC
jgi:hypothetical protein